jgi:hypothetical protein
MSVPLSVDHRVRMLIWGWAVEGYGVDDIVVKLQALGHYVDTAAIWEILLQAQKVKR